MNLYPAIDMLEGKAVRLRRGDFNAKKVYDEDPLEAARRWVQEGARELHLVDLDGARAGAPVNLEHVRRIAGELAVPIQLGGGLRTRPAIEQALQAGARRVILGTAALTEPSLLEEALREWPEQVMVSVDTRAGVATTAGWTHTTNTPGPTLVRRLQECGVQRIVYTDVDRDGMLGGPNVEEIGRLARTLHTSTLIYSGGIGALSDLEALRALAQPSLGGVIVGKALYEGKFTVAQALAALAD